MARRDELFKRNKARLKKLYKQFKAGLISEDKISDTDKDLLVKYYGIKIAIHEPPSEWHEKIPENAGVPEDNDQSESEL